MDRLTLALILIAWIALCLFVAACFRASANADKASDDLADQIANGEFRPMPPGKAAAGGEPAAVTGQGRGGYGLSHDQGV